MVKGAASGGKKEGFRRYKYAEVQWSQKKRVTEGGNMHSALLLTRLYGTLTLGKFYEQSPGIW